MEWARWGMRRGRAARLALALALLAGTLAGVAPVTAQDGAAPPPLALELVAEGFSRPVYLVDADDGSGRMFVAEQTGAVRILRDGQVQERPFLDVSGQISTGSEQGLLSIALHPDFAENGTFFISYTDTAGDTQVERWQVSADDPNVADPDSAETLLTVDQPYPNHNGGLLLFDPAGYLTIGLGDGGSQGDPQATGQDPTDLLGSILRIDVDGAAGDLPYAIPADNPFADGVAGRPEVWAYGLRNPWRYSFDRETGDLFIADVGGTAYEEINVLPAGGEGRNFGWSEQEGPSCLGSAACETDGLVPPIFAYTHEVGGCSVTGGYVYRGEAAPELAGTYLFGDYCSGLLWGLTRADDGTWAASAPLETGLSVSSFAEDASGELYVVDLQGGVYRVVAAE